MTMFFSGNSNVVLTSLSMDERRHDDENERGQSHLYFIYQNRTEKENNPDLIKFN